MSKLKCDGITITGGGRSVYSHVIKGGQNSIGYIVTEIITNSPTPFTFQSFVKWLYDNGFRDTGTSIENNNKRYWCVGVGASAYIQSLSAPNSNTLSMYFGGFMQGRSNTTSWTWFSDTVRQIL